MIFGENFCGLCNGASVLEPDWFASADISFTCVEFPLYLAIVPYFHIHCWCNHDSSWQFPCARYVHTLPEMKQLSWVTIIFCYSGSGRAPLLTLQLLELIVSPKDATPQLLRIVTNFEIHESFLLRRFPLHCIKEESLEDDVVQDIRQTHRRCSAEQIIQDTLL